MRSAPAETAPVAASELGGGRIARFLPAVAWLRTCSVAGVRADVVAGFTLAAYLLPSAIADASIAGLPAESGLYAAIVSGAVFWALCGSRQTAISATTAISVVLGASLGAMSRGDTSRHAALAAGAALMVAALCLVAWSVRAGSLMNFVSESVMVGFKAGVALVLALKQLPKLLGVEAAHGSFFEGCAHLFAHAHEAHALSWKVGVAALLALVAGRLFFKNRPVALLVMAGAIALSSATGLASRGVAMLGSVPAGAPTLAIPSVTPDDLNELLPLALACFLLAGVETAAIGRMFSARGGARFDANQELLALAGANAAAGLGRGFPVSGGMSQSLVNESAGARTPLSGLIASGLMLVVALWCTGLLESLPQPVLAAIVLNAAAGLVNAPMIRRFWREDRVELLVAGAALAGVLAAGLLHGVLVGALISLLLLLRQASRPHVAFLGRIPGSRRYSDLARHEDNEAVPGFVVLRPEASLLYFNADHVRDAVIAEVARSVAPVRAVVCDLSASPNVDIAGADMLKHLAVELRARGVDLRIVEARARVRDRLRAAGLEECAGRIDRFTSLADAIESAGGSEQTGVARA